jgi:exopolysaccharide biosynthesis protein
VFEIYLILTMFYFLVSPRGILGPLVLQDAISSLNTKSEMLLEKLMTMEDRVGSLSEKYFKIEQEKIAEIKAQLTCITDKQKTTSIQQDEQIQVLGKIVEDAQSDIYKKLQQQKITEYKKQNGKLQKQSLQFTTDLNKVQELTQNIELTF